MQHQEFEAPEALRDTIKCFWYNRRDSDEEQSSFEVVPDGLCRNYLSFREWLQHCYKRWFTAIAFAVYDGAAQSACCFYTKSLLEVIGIRCFPWTVFDLLGLPSGKDGVRLFEHPIAQLQSVLTNLMDAGRVAEALALVKQYFLDARSGVAIDSMLFKAGIAMGEANGAMPVSEVAAAAHATVRTLERKFKQSSGYTVKDVSGLMRFEQVRNQLWSNPDCNITGLAHELGYTDQSHLSREFKRYSGTTPAAFARKAKKRKQAVSDNFVAFIQA